MKSIKYIITCCAVLSLLMVGCSNPESNSTTKAQPNTQEFEFKDGYPTSEASEALYNEMDYQRAVQAYIWATPLLNSMGYRAGFAEHDVTEKNLKIGVLQFSYLPQHTVMTANQTTPYFFSVANLKHHGPVVAVVPPLTKY